MAFNPSFGGYGGAPGGYAPGSTAPPYGAPMPQPSMPQPSMPQPSMPQPCMPPPPGLVVPPASQPSAFCAHPSSYGAGAAPYPPTGGAPPMGIAGPNQGQEIWSYFQAVDADHSGRITSVELHKALIKGNLSQLKPETCKHMISMFDVDRNGTIDFKEFEALWKYIQEWKACFDRFDANRSGNIDANELQNGLRIFGYSLSLDFAQLCIRLFDKRLKRTITFDDFIQCCMTLKSLSEKFRAKDVKQAGSVTVHYEEFLQMTLDSVLS